MWLQDRTEQKKLEEVTKVVEEDDPRLYRARES